MTLNEAIRELEAIKALAVESIMENGLSEEKALEIAGNASLITRYPGGCSCQLTPAHITVKHVEYRHSYWKEHCVHIGVSIGSYGEE